MHLAVVGNLLAPRRVIVIGPMVQAGELVLEPIRTAITRHIAPNTVPEIVLGSLGTRNTALGALALALDEPTGSQRDAPGGSGHGDRGRGGVRLVLQRHFVTMQRGGCRRNAATAPMIRRCVDYR